MISKRIISLSNVAYSPQGIIQISKRQIKKLPAFSVQIDFRSIYLGK